MADPDSTTAVMIVGIVCGLPMLIGMAAIYFNHQQKMAKLTGGSNVDVEKITARLEAVEKQCAKLQEQVNDAHALLVDERRVLDLKLAQKLAEGSAVIPNDTPK